MGAERASADKDFLISYAGPDLAWAEWIAWELEAAGYSVAVRAWDIRPGQNVILQRDQAIRTTERVIAVLTPRYLDAVTTLPDWTAALARDPTAVGATLVPVKVEACEPRGALGTLLPIDLVGLQEQQARTALVEGLRPWQGSRGARGAFPPTVRPALERPTFPAALPKIWTVPYERQPDRFVGREDELKELERRLTRDAIAGRQIIFGMGGVGKTQLAVEYAYRYRSRYTAVCWIHAGQSGPLVADYAALELLLGLSSTQRSDQSLTLGAVRDWFEENDEWLLVFDDAGAPDDVVGEGTGFERFRDFLPPPGHGHVLVTSKDREWSRVGELLTVDVLSPLEARSFLLRQTKSDDESSAGRIADALGYLPLALEQARAYVDAAGLSLVEYLERLREFPELFDRGKPRDYTGTVTTALSVSIEKVRDRSAAAAHLLEIFAFLAPEDIPRDEWFLEPPANLPPVLDEAAHDTLARDDAIIMLNRFSLVRPVAPFGLNVHPLVQAAVRKNLAEEERKSRIATAVSLTDHLFPDDFTDPTRWALCDRLVAHVFSCVRFAHESDAELPRAADLVERALNYLFLRARFAEAHTQANLSLALVKAAYGDDQQRWARALMNYGEIHYELGDLLTARTHLERALAMEDIGDTLDARTRVRLLTSLGLVHVELGELTPALKLQERALTLAESSDEVDDVAVARVMSSLGVVHYELGNRQQARTCQERAQSLMPPETPNPTSHIIARRLAMVLYDLGSFSESRSNLEEGVRYFDQALGEDHPEVAKSLHHLGFVLWGLGELSTAQAYFERALQIFRAAYRRPHPAVARTLAGLGVVLQDQGELDKALRCQLKAVHILENLLGRDHFEVGRALDKLGFVLRNLGQHSDARRQHERAVEILRTAFGSGHPELAIPLSNLGLVLHEMSRFSEADACHAEAVSILEEYYPFEHPHRQLAVCRRALTLARTGNPDEASRILEQAIPIIEKGKSPDHPDIARTREKLADVLEQRHEFERARLERQAALEIFTRRYGPSHPRTKISAARLNDLERRTGVP